MKLISWANTCFSFVCFSQSQGYVFTSNLFFIQSLCEFKWFSKEVPIWYRLSQIPQVAKCTSFLWLVSASWSANCRLHKLQWTDDSTWTLFLCDNKSLGQWNDLSQKLHCHFELWWALFTCLDKVFDKVKTLLQILQFHFFCVWIDCTCLLKSRENINDCWQTSHWNLMFKWKALLCLFKSRLSPYCLLQMWHFHFFIVWTIFSPWLLICYWTLTWRFRFMNEFLRSSFSGSTRMHRTVRI